MAPCCCNWPATSSAGESRISSEFGLKATPRTAALVPTRDPQISRVASITRLRCLILMLSTTCKNVTTSPRPSSSARVVKARMSFGRHPPPKPNPASRNSRPIRLSTPIAPASMVTSADVASHTSEIALMNEIFVARKRWPPLWPTRQSPDLLLKTGYHYWPITDCTFCQRFRCPVLVGGSTPTTMRSG